MGVSPEHLAQALVGRHEERHRRERARAETLTALVSREVSELLREGLVRRAWLIGSLAWGGFGAGSDVDLVVEGLGVAGAPAVWDRLCEKLEARVDLIRIEEIDEAFSRRVRTEGRPLHDG